MKRIRTKAAKFSIRDNRRKHSQFLWLDPPYPQPEDHEWGLRISMDKYRILIDNPGVEDGGSGSMGLCWSAGHLTDMDNQCGSCPIKKHTNVPNCMGSFLYEPYWKAITYEQRKYTYQSMLEMLSDIYQKDYGSVYVPDYFEEDAHE